MSIEQELEEQVMAQLRPRLMQPKSPADMERFWSELERSASDHQDALVVFDSAFVWGGDER